MAVLAATDDEPRVEPRRWRPRAPRLGVVILVVRVLAAAALVWAGWHVWTTMGPANETAAGPVDGAIGISGPLREADLKDTLNEDTADSAPKQIVTNGWYTNDLVIALDKQVHRLSTQIAELPAATPMPEGQDPRVAASLLLLVGAAGGEMVLRGIEHVGLRGRPTPWA